MQKRLRWYGHVRRRYESHITRTVLDMEVEGRRCETERKTEIEKHGYHQERYQEEWTDGRQHSRPHGLEIGSFQGDPLTWKSLQGEKVRNSIVRKTDTRLSKGKDVVVCLPGARIEHVTERVEQIMGRGNGGSIVIHIGTNNADKEGTTAIVEKYMSLLKKTKQARVGQIILSEIWPVFGNRIRGYRNSKRMSVNGMVKLLKAALQGRGSGIRGFVGQLCGERRNVRERWLTS